MNPGELVRCAEAIDLADGQITADVQSGKPYVQCSASSEVGVIIINVRRSQEADSQRSSSPAR